MRAVLQQMAPGVPAIDLLADAPGRNPEASAYLLAAYAEWFSRGHRLSLCCRPPA
jgi:S-adenosyl-L-methionine hydrolase (adenosine-forming)